MAENPPRASFENPRFWRGSPQENGPTGTTQDLVERETEVQDIQDDLGVNSQNNPTNEGVQPDTATSAWVGEVISQDRQVTEDGREFEHVQQNKFQGWETSPSPL